MECPKCKSQEKVKNGFVNGGNRRWKCKECGCNYTKSEPRGYPRWMRRRALEMYLEGVGFRGIGRLLKVSNVVVLYWIREMGEKVKELREDIKAEPHCEVMELDEMWHYVQKKNKSFGYGSLMIGTESESLPSSVEIVMIGQDSSSGRK